MARNSSTSSANATTEKTDKSARRFAVHIPGYSGVHPTGIRFIDNNGHTDSPEIAEAARQQGWEVSEVADEHSTEAAAAAQA